MVLEADMSDILLGVTLEFGKICERKYTLGFLAKNESISSTPVCEFEYFSFSLNRYFLLPL